MYFRFTAAITLGYFGKGFTIKKIGMTYYIWTGWKKMLALASLQKNGVNLQEKDLLCENMVTLGDIQSEC